MEALVAATELAPLEEHVGKAVYWPPWLRELALKDWLDLPERFKLTVHLMATSRRRSSSQSMLLQDCVTRRRARTSSISWRKSAMTSSPTPANSSSTGTSRRRPRSRSRSPRWTTSFAGTQRSRCCAPAGVRWMLHLDARAARTPTCSSSSVAATIER